MPKHWYLAPSVFHEPVADPRTLVYRNADNEEPLNVYAFVDDDIVCIDQGGDRIAIPYEDIGRFLDTLEGLFVTLEAERRAVE